MSALHVVFLIVSSVGLLSALGTVLARNLVHAALFLVAFFFAIACQFVLLEAEFLAAMQVLVYIGAVSILLLFGIMLTRNIQGDETTAGHWARKLPAGIVAAGVLGVLLFGILAEGGRPGQQAWSRTAGRPGGVNPRVGGPEAVALAYSPSGQFVGSADRDGRVRLWTPGGRQVAAFGAGRFEPKAVAFGVEGGLVAAADDRGEIRAWRTLSRREALARFGGRPGAVTALAVGYQRAGADDPDDRLLASGGADGVVRLWDGPDPGEIEAHDGPILAISFAPDGRLVTVGADRTIKSWDLRTGAVDEIASSRDGRPIAAAAIGLVPPPEARLSDEEEPPPEPPPAGGAPGPLVAVATLADGMPGRWDLRVLNAPDGAEVASFEGPPGVPIAVALGVDARRVAALVGPAEEAEGEGAAAAPAAARLLVWGLDDAGADPAELAPPIGGEGLALLAAGPLGTRLATGGGGGPLAFFDDREGSWRGPAGAASAASAVIADMPRAVGDELMTRYVIPFEVAGLMLTAALIGAIVLARHDPGDVPTVPDAVASRVASGRPIAPSALDGSPAAMPSASPGDGDGTPAHVPETPGARPSR